MPAALLFAGHARKDMCCAGMPGFTAWVGQIAQRKGARAIGSAGSDDKVGLLGCGTMAGHAMLAAA